MRYFQAMIKKHPNTSINISLVLGVVSLFMLSASVYTHMPDSLTLNPVSVALALGAFTLTIVSFTLAYVSGEPKKARLA